MPEHAEWIRENPAAITAGYFLSAAMAILRSQGDRLPSETEFIRNLLLGINPSAVAERILIDIANVTKDALTNAMRQYSNRGENLFNRMANMVMRRLVARDVIPYYPARQPQPATPYAPKAKPPPPPIAKPAQKTCSYCIS